MRFTARQITGEQEQPMPPAYAQAYLADDAYAALLDRIEDAFLNPGLCRRSALIEALGAANVWPLKCLEDRLDERQRRRERGLDRDA